MAKNFKLNTGWYVSEKELMFHGYAGTDIYLFEAESNTWSQVGHGWISEENLPEAPENMWPLKPIMR